jgi:hypothetical protein
MFLRANLRSQIDKISFEMAKFPVFSSKTNNNREPIRVSDTKGSKIRWRREENGETRKSFGDGGNRSEGNALNLKLSENRSFGFDRWRNDIRVGECIARIQKLE